MAAVEDCVPEAKHELRVIIIIVSDEGSKVIKRESLEEEIESVINRIHFLPDRTIARFFLPETLSLWRI